MKIRGTDLEILAGSEDSLTYVKWDLTYDDNGKLVSEVEGEFDETDVITMNIYASSDDNTVILSKVADIIDGKACISLLEADTTTLTPNTYIYDIFCESLTTGSICLIAPSNFEIVGTSKTDLGS